MQVEEVKQQNTEEKLSHRLNDSDDFMSRRVIWVNGPVIVGAGPSGIATAACLKEQGVPFLLLERQDYIASCWQKTSCDRLKLHLPKNFYQLPNIPFPQDFPPYPTIRQYIDYLESYADHFGINPRFNEFVRSAKYDETSGLWRVRVFSTAGSDRTEVEYICKWLVVAIGEHDEFVKPDIDGLAEFRGEIIHACEYKSGEKFRGQKVLVVGCGNSGMEVSLDLCKHNAFPILVVRSPVHVLPREICGKSIFELAVLLLMWLPLWLVDKLLLIVAWLLIGNVEKYGLKRPSMGPFELMNTMGKTPVLNNGALEKIRVGDIKIVPAAIKKFRLRQVELANGEKLDIDSVVFATGYRSNIPSWLQEGEYFSKNGSSKTRFPNGWKGKSGLYAAGFTSSGLSGASSDALRIASDIGKIWKEESSSRRKKNNVFPHRRCVSEF